MKKVFIVLCLFLFGIGLTFIGWRFFRNNTKTASVSETIHIGIFTYPGYAPFYIAQDLGLFDKYNVNVSIDQITTDTAFPAIQSGNIQMLAGTSDMMAVMADVEIPAKQIFSTSTSYGADGLAVSKDIASLADLKGKTVYVAFGFPDHFLMRKLQYNAGLNHEDISLINMDPVTAGASFVAGKINAGWTFEPYLSETNKRSDGYVLITSKDTQEFMPVDIIAARNDLLESRPDDVKHIIQAFFEASSWWENNIDAGNVIVARAFKLSPEEFAPSRSTVKFATIQSNVKLFNRVTPWNVFEQVEQAGEIYFQDDIIKTKIAGASVTDGNFIQELGKK